MQCRKTNQRVTLFLEFSHAAFEGNWLGIVEGIRDVMTVWVSLLAADDILLTKAAIDDLLDSSVF